MKNLKFTKTIRNWTIVVVCLIVWLNISNDTIAYLSGLDEVEEVEISLYERKDPIYWVIDSFEARGDMLESVNVRGWAFAETLDKNSDRYMELVFRGNPKSYCLTPSLPEDLGAYGLYVIRDDVQEVYSDLNIPRDEVGFISTFTTIDMLDGIYDVYIYCSENNENYGIVDTGLVMNKKGAEISLTNWTARPMDDIVAANQKKEAVTHIDSIQRNEEQVSIWGWAIPDFKNADYNIFEQKIYLQITDESKKIYQYETKRLMRKDVAEAYGNPEMMDCGFNTVICLDDLPDGGGEVQLLIKNGADVWKSAIYTYEKAGNDISIK